MLILTDAIKLKMIQYFGNDSKRINHALKVHSFARLIMNYEQLDESSQLIVDAAALLHDIGIKEAEKKYNSSAGKYQELEGPAIAKELLSAFKLETSILERILYLIGHHHSYAKIDGIDFQILVESDFIVNIFEDEMNPQSIQSVKEKYFQTAAGKDLLTTMYL